MRYIIRLVYHCKRGRVSDVIEGLQVVNQVYISQGFDTNGKLYVDRSGHMDTAVFEFEVDSLDKFFDWQREAYANPFPEAVPLIDSLNEAAVEGYREIYELVT
jgi:hypothetical protein